MSCDTVNLSQLNTLQLALRVKNTFLDIQECDYDADDRQRAHTAPGAEFASLVDEISSDSEDELEVWQGCQSKMTLPRAETVATKEETYIDSESAKEIRKPKPNPSEARHVTIDVGNHCRGESFDSMRTTSAESNADSVRPALRIKNTFLDIQEEHSAEFINRRRGRTAPAGMFTSLLDELSSDSEAEDEVVTKTMTCARAPTLAPALTNQGVQQALQAIKVSVPKEGCDGCGRHDGDDCFSDGISDDEDEACSVRRPMDRHKTWDRYEDITNEVVPIDFGPAAVSLIMSSSCIPQCMVMCEVRNLAPLPADVGHTQRKATDHTRFGSIDSMCSASLQSDAEDLQGNVWSLSRSSKGSWKVQQALEAARTEKDRLEIASELEGRVWEAALDLHANFVLQKIIVLMHQGSVQFIIDELSRFPGAVCIAAKNKYGCRVIQRLLECCSTTQMASMIEDLLQNVPTNCQNRYCTFVMKSLLEHCTGSEHHRLIQTLMTHLQDVSTNCNGCSVIYKALTTGAQEDQEALAKAILSTPPVFAQIKVSQGEPAARLTVQLAQGFECSEIESECVQESTSALQPSSSEPKLMKTGSRSRRRGGGGGAEAQAEAEARDRLESLYAACRRRAPVRITKAMEKIVRSLDAPSTLPPTLIIEASQACEQAKQVLWSLAAEKKKRAV